MRHRDKLLLFVALFILASSVGLSFMAATHREESRIPLAGLHGDGRGYCVALYEGDVMLGLTIVPRVPMQALAAHPEKFAISTHNALLAIIPGDRPDLLSAANDLTFVDLPGPFDEPSGVVVTEGASTTMECYCQNTIWSGDPRSGGTPIGCGGACGSCTKCVVRAIR